LAAGRDMELRDRAIIAAGMIPRGEVGIIVAALALSEGAIGKQAFSAVIAMVLVTTLLAPSALRLALKTSTRTDPPALPLA
jgi:Kef-type K+ transport system membrane component KefB